MGRREKAERDGGKEKERGRGEESKVKGI